MQKKLPFIEIILVNKIMPFSISQPLGEYSPKTKKITIYLRYASQTDLVKETLKHEILHKWHDTISGLGKTKIVAKRIINLSNNSDIYKKRIFLSLIINTLISEGFTFYKEIYSDEKVNYDKDTFDKWYEKAIRTAKYCELKIKNNPGRIEDDEITSHISFIGFHIIFTTLYLDKDMDFNYLLTLDYMKFIKLYEKCMKKVGKDPVISLTSGNGILDYKRMVEELGENKKEEVNIDKLESITN